MTRDEQEREWAKAEDQAQVELDYDDDFGRLARIIGGAGWNFGTDEEVAQVERLTRLWTEVWESGALILLEEVIQCHGSRKRKPS